MDETNDNVMVALLPVNMEWCDVELPHLTLVYVGKVSDLKPTDLNKLTKIGSDVAQTSNPLWLKISGVEIFGDEEPTDVLRVIPSPYLLAIRSFFEEWDNGEFPVYKPHVSIGPADRSQENLPIMLFFDRILIGWGDTQFVFKFAGT